MPTLISGQRARTTSSITRRTAGSWVRRWVRRCTRHRRRAPARPRRRPTQPAAVDARSLVRQTMIRTTATAAEMATARAPWRGQRHRHPTHGREQPDDDGRDGQLGQDVPDVADHHEAGDVLAGIAPAAQHQRVEPDAPGPAERHDVGDGAAGEVERHRPAAAQPGQRAGQDEGVAEQRQRPHAAQQQHLGERHPRQGAADLVPGRAGRAGEQVGSCRRAATAATQTTGRSRTSARPRGALGSRTPAQPRCCRCRQHPR